MFGFISGLPIMLYWSMGPLLYQIHTDLIMDL